MAANDLVSRDWLLAAFCTCKPGCNSAAITSGVVSLACLKVPVVDLAKLCEACLLKLSLAVVDGVEVGGGGVEAV